MTSTAAVRTLRLLLAAVLLHMAASSGCDCSAYSSDSGSADTVEACTSAGDGTGCMWKPGNMFGGTCKGECTTTSSGDSSATSSGGSSASGSTGTGGSGGGGCTCSAYDSNDDDADTVEACTSAGDGTGCMWNGGLAYGGTCEGTCIGVTTGTDEEGQPSMDDCAKFGSWNEVLTTGGKTKCEEADCEWLKGKVTGGSCVPPGACDSGLDAEKDALGKMNQATILISCLAVAMAILVLYQFRVAHRERLKVRAHEEEILRQVCMYLNTHTHTHTHTHTLTTSTRTHAPMHTGE